MDMLRFFVTIAFSPSFNVFVQKKKYWNIILKMSGTYTLWTWVKVKVSWHNVAMDISNNLMLINAKNWLASIIWYIK